MYKIGMFSKINKVTIKTLHYYDEMGLLKPGYVDENNGYRYYTNDQLPTLHKILALKQIGFSIEEIGEILNGRNIFQNFEKKKQELETIINETHEKYTRLTHYLENLKEDSSMAYQVVIKELPEVIVYSKRMIIPNYNAYFEVIPQIGREISDANPDIKCQEPAYCFVIYHDIEYKEENIDVEYCEAVTFIGIETPTIKFKKIEMVPISACCFHKGPYSTLRNAYAYIFKWIEDNGYEMVDSPRESYIDGIWNKEDEEDWLTELQIPIRKK